ncbi:MAG: tetratricopeptide repeat protein [Thiomargarita sp.]|nr:tetratricopeptide repeat protein [Thiomargarita sp.]
MQHARQPMFPKSGSTSSTGGKRISPPTYFKPEPPDDLNESNEPEIKSLDQMIEVVELSPAEAMNLFRHYYPTESNLLPTLLDKIYHHTLLIELVAKAGKKKRLSIKQLLKRLDSRLIHRDLQRVITVGSHAESHLKDKQAKLYQYILAMFEPAKLDKNKQQILQYFSVLPAEDIPLAHLKTLFDVEDDNQLENDLESLFQSGWLSAKDESYKMHTLVQDVVFIKLKVNNANVVGLIVTLSEIMQQPLMVDDYLNYAKAITQKITTFGYEIGWLNSFLSDVYQSIGQLDNALLSIEMAKVHFENCNDKYSLTASYNHTGRIYQALGEIDKALAFFELCKNLTKELYESNPKSEPLKNGLAISYQNLGKIHKEKGEVDKALAFFELEADLFKALYESNPKSERFKNGLIISYERLGEIHQALGEVDKALAFFELEYDLKKALFELNPKDERLKDELADSCFKLGDIHQGLGKIGKALTFFKSHHNLSQELYESNPENERLKYKLATSYFKLGEIYQIFGELDKALPLFLKTDLFRELYKSNPKNTLFRNGLIVSYERLGDIHQALGEVDKALAFFELLTEFMKQLYQLNPKNVELKNGLAASYSKLAGIYQDKKIPFYKFATIRQNKQQVVALYENAMTLWQELYQTTQLDIYKANAEKVHSQVKMPKAKSLHSK